MIKGSNLTPRIEKICTKCEIKYFAKVHNSTICQSCRDEKNKLKECQCGCGQLTKRKWALGHGLRGRTYREIYGDKIPKCGFAKGDLNPNFTRSKFIGCKLENKIGERFRSSLEVQFSEFCIENDIPYKYEERVKLIDGRVKIVDFVLFNTILVEITGFAYKGWQEIFIEKMKLLRQSTINPILILTYPKYIHTNSLIRKCLDIDVFVDSIESLETIIKKINMFRHMIKSNTELFNLEYKIF